MIIICDIYVLCAFVNKFLNLSSVTNDDNGNCEVPSPAETRSSPATPKPSEKVNWTREQDDQLAEFYRSNPMFWDQADPNFSDKLLRGRVLQEFADGMGLNVTYVMLWFRSQRSAYSRNKKSRDRRSSASSKPQARGPKTLWNLSTAM